MTLHASTVSIQAFRAHTHLWEGVPEIVKTDIYMTNNALFGGIPTPYANFAMLLYNRDRLHYPGTYMLVQYVCIYLLCGY